MIGNFVALQSVHGWFIVPRKTLFQSEHLVKNGRTHIESELANLLNIAGVLEDGSIIIDGGANAGFVSIPLAQRLRQTQSKIIAFEPQSQLYNALCGSLALNDLHNCFVHNKALGASSGMVTLPSIDYSQEQDFGTIKVEQTGKVREHSYMRNLDVEMVTIDSLQLPRLDLLKLDIEGYESAAIMGGLETIKQHYPYIWCEFFIVGVETVKASLSSVPGYRFYQVDYQNMLCIHESRAHLLQLNSALEL